MRSEVDTCIPDSIDRLVNLQQLYIESNDSYSKPFRALWASPAEVHFRVRASLLLDKGNGSTWRRKRGLAHFDSKNAEALMIFDSIRVQV